MIAANPAARSGSDKSCAESDLDSAASTTAISSRRKTGANAGGSRFRENEGDTLYGFLWRLQGAAEFLAYRTVLLL
ncbi:MAG TPA: hypothetical protein VK432_00865 [Stellaceae bacterium]|nr:hypothetical protein [Stellaceae bacterium]